MGPTAESSTLKDVEEGTVQHNMSEQNMGELQKKNEEAIQSIHVQLAVINGDIQMLEAKAQKDNEETKKIVQKDNVEIKKMVQYGNDEIKMVEKDNDEIKKMVQKHNDETKQMVQNNNDEAKKMVLDSTKANDTNLLAMQKQIQELEVEMRKAIHDELAAVKSCTMRKWATEVFLILLCVYGMMLLFIGITDIFWSYIGKKAVWSWGPETIQ